MFFTSRAELLTMPRLDALVVLFLQGKPFLTATKIDLHPLVLAFVT